MNQFKQTNTFIGGMNMDLDYSLMKDNQYIYAENVRLVTNDNGTFGVLQTIEGFDVCNPSVKLDNGERIIHTDVIRDYGVLFTVDQDGNNSIYRYDFSKTNLEPQVRKVFTGKLDIKEPISSVCRWESSDNIKVYWADGEHQIRVLNISPSKDTYNETINPDELNIVPNSTLPALVFKGYGSGSLNSGKIQYVYQLFNVRGTETNISALTPMIKLSKSDISNPTVIGTAYKEPTGKSVKLEVNIGETTFTHARIIAIYYSEKNKMPEIYTVDEIGIGNGMLVYEDSGNSKINELTIDEFNALVSYTFVPKVLETKDGRLFAANTTEDTWDVKYDARAYRCNSGGLVLLKSYSGNDKEFPMINVKTEVIDIDHDCINPYNADDTQPYKYFFDSFGALKLGGKGPNVEYTFVKTPLIEDNTVTSGGLLQESNSLNSVTTTLSHLALYESNSDVPLALLELPENTSYSLSYGDPTIDTLVRGYQRDEIYRFGVVFYNEKNLASPVHWIGDIRMPKNSESKTFDSGVRVDLTNGFSYTNVALVTFPMGLRFKVENIPAGVTGVEIVRCERTLADRGIIGQGVLSKLARENRFKDGLIQSNIIKPYPYLVYVEPKHAGYVGNPFAVATVEAKNTHVFDELVAIEGFDFQNAKTTVENIYNWYSPEVSVNREESESAFANATHIEEVSRIFSMMTPREGDDGLGRTFASLSTWVASSGNGTRARDGVIRQQNMINGNKVDFVVLSNFADNDSGENYYKECGPCETTAKYYSAVYLNNHTKVGIQELKYAPNLEWNQFNKDASLLPNTAIGGYSFVNLTDRAIVVGDGYNLESKYYSKALNGPSLLLRMDDTSEIPPTNQLELADIYRKHQVSSTVLCNIRKASALYGGQTYTSRQNSVYISCGNYLKVTGTSHGLNTFGGDTYINVFDCALNTQYFHIDDYEADKNMKMIHSFYVPVESTINLLMRNDEFRMSRDYNPYMQNDISVIGNVYSQNKPMYAYNDAYSTESTIKKYVSKDLYSISNLQTDARIMASEEKIDNEVSDAWTKFKIANFVDVDNQWGSVNNLVNFKNTLVYLQTDAVGTLVVNERSLISDNNPGALTLGTGDVLGRYDYITTKNGSRVDSLRSVTQSDSALYWYDHDRAEICALQDGLQTLSKLKGVQSYLNDKHDTFVSNPNYVYDKKYNESLLTLDNKTLAFNEQVGVFTSFYTIKPDWYFEFSDRMYTFKDNNLFKYNSGDTKQLYNVDQKWSKLQFVVNADYIQTKTFDNVDYSGDFTWGNNLTNIVFNTKRQESFVTTKDKIDYREDTYKFAIPRSNRELNDIQNLVNKSYRDRMKGKYLVSTYYYDNNNENTFKLPYISTTYRHSYI